MGGHGYVIGGAINNALNNIVKGQSKYVVRLMTLEEITNEPKILKYELFDELDEKKIRESAKNSEKFYHVKLSGIEMWSLEAKPAGKIKL